MRDDIESGGFRPAGKEISGANAIEAVAAWCKAMQNGIPIVQGLRNIADTLGADLAAVSRVGHLGKEGGRDGVQMVAFDRRANLSAGVEAFRFSAAEAVCGKYLSTCKPGSVWNARTSELAANPQLALALRHRQLLEVVVTPLEHHVNRSDFLELHFPRYESAGKIDGIGMIAGTLSEAWKTRQLGLLSKSLLRARQTGAAPRTRTDVLALENPCRLSRAEYRVCLLLSAGLNNAALLGELSIGPATLRTHLRNIYSKTETACQTELVQLLLAAGERAAGAGISSPARHHVA